MAYNYSYNGLQQQLNNWG